MIVRAVAIAIRIPKTIMRIKTTMLSIATARMTARTTVWVLARARKAVRMGKSQRKPPKKAVGISVRMREMVGITAPLIDLRRQRKKTGTMRTKRKIMNHELIHSHQRHLVLVRDLIVPVKEINAHVRELTVK